MTFITGDNSLGELTDNKDTILAAHILQLRESIPATGVVATTIQPQYTSSELQTAVSAGGLVVLREGTYTLSSELQIPSNTIIRGMGKNKTIIKFANNVSGAAYALRNATQSGSGNSFIGIEDLTIDVNGTNNTGLKSGIFFIRVTDFWIKNVEVKDATYDAIGLNQCQRGIVTGCYSHDHNEGAEGISCSSGTEADNVETQNIIFSHNICHNCSSYGISVHKPGLLYMQPKNIIIANNICYDIEGTLFRGINVKDGTHVTIIGNTCYGNQHGIYLDELESNECSYNKVIGNTCKNQTGSGACGIYMNNGYYNLIQGNTLIDDQAVATQKYGLTMVNDNYHQIIDNITKGNSLYDYNLAVGSGITNIYDLDGSTVFT